FWKIHDPTTLNRQGPDIGEQYRSVIFYYDKEQEKTARASKEELQQSGLYKRDIVTEIVPAEKFKFYIAEDYHQQYLKKRERSSCRF
ncbi:MAG TPA: peptide-methionine (S)-S-oxide reductase, partial [Methanobacterium sp.]|nr:peptide-methionine (S)-S-oxide reductase [Methanobacterium sp.]